MFQIVSMTTNSLNWAPINRWQSRGYLILTTFKTNDQCKKNTIHWVDLNYVQFSAMKLYIWLCN
jgi:hypothetical protein